MRRGLLFTTGLAWLALAGAAGAATVTLSPGPMNPQYFASEPAHANNFTLDGIMWTGTNAGTEKGTTPDVDAAPLGMGTSTSTGTTYMAVQSGGSETATWSKPQTSLSIYWGSIDAGICGGGSQSCGNVNSISISMDNFTLTGKQLMSLGALGKGSETSAADNELVKISGLSPFTEVTFRTTGNAFEFSLPGSGSAVPEPSTWAMLALGFAGLGYAAFRRNSKKGDTALGAI